VKKGAQGYSHDSIIRPGLIFFKLFKNKLSTVLIIESFDIFWNSTYNRDSTYNFSQFEFLLSTVLIIKSFGIFLLKTTNNRESTLKFPLQNFLRTYKRQKLSFHSI